MKIDTCLSGEEAIRKFLLKNKPDSLEPYNYIFLDWNMPVMDGYETNSKIKFYVKDESYLDCPIIICSAYDGKLLELERLLDSVLQCIYCILEYQLLTLSLKKKVITRRTFKQFG